MKPLYCPYGSGYVSLIFQVQQLGITRLTPSAKSAMRPKTGRHDIAEILLKHQK
jgi:hypothetical protein